LPEICAARPRAATSIARVAMNGTSRPYATSRPLMEPAIVPTASAAKIMPPAPKLCVATVVDQTPARAMSAPTDRSMPPPMITNVIPTVTTPIAAACCRITIMLLTTQSVSP